MKGGPRGVRHIRAQPTGERAVAQHPALGPAELGGSTTAAIKTRYSSPTQDVPWKVPGRSHLFMVGTLPFYRSHNFDCARDTDKFRPAHKHILEGIFSLSKKEPLHRHKTQHGKRTRCFICFPPPSLKVEYLEVCCEVILSLALSLFLCVCLFLFVLSITTSFY